MTTTESPPRARVRTQGAPKPPEGTSDKGETQASADEPVAISPLDGVREFITKYVALSDTQADALTLWVAHSHCFEACETTPYIRISSVGAGSGKTRTLEVLELLVANPWLTGRITGPALVRKIDESHPTLLLDETDALFTGGNASQQMLRGVLNSGYRIGGKVAYAKGNSYQELDVFCPKAFAGIGGLPRTIADRSIPIVLKKRTMFQKIERMRQRDAKVEARVPRMIVQRFALANLNHLTRARPHIPAALDDRAADVWEPLFAIADIAGGDWAKRARVAAVELCADRKGDNTNEDVSFRLLSACRDIFIDMRVPRLKTVTLLEELHANPDWQAIDGRPLDPRLLSDILRSFGIGPRTLRFGRQVLSGYERHTFDQVWASIMPVAEGETP